MSKPQLHFIPTNHWMNDPNGFIYYKGNYHLFYQYFPYENAWGTMHWGHKISKDLLHWEDLGIALYPSKIFDKNGCFSGSAIEIDEKMYIYYSGTVYDAFLGEDIHRQAKDAFHSNQVLIVSDDGFTFDNTQKQVIVPAPKVSGRFGHHVHTRDPKVFKKDGKFYMLLGTKYMKENATKYTGEALIYESENPIDFKLIGTLEDDSIGNNWECPDYFEIDGQGILTISPEHYFEDKNGYVSIAAFMPVKFENGQLIKTGDCELLDLGKDTYACQSNFDEHGVPTQIAWMRMPIPEKDNQWIGMYACPRTFSYKNNHLYTHPHPYFKNAFAQKCEEFSFEEARHICVDMNDHASMNIGGYKIEYKDNQLIVDRSDVFPNDKNIDLTITTPTLDHCHLDIYTDVHIIEIFINDGYHVLSHIVYNTNNTLEMNNCTNFTMHKVK